VGSHSSAKDETEQYQLRLEMKYPTEMAHVRILTERVHHNHSQKWM